MKWIFKIMVTSLLFFPEKSYNSNPKDYGLTAEDAWIITEDKVKIHGWYFGVKDAGSTILFFHGNAGNIADRLFKAQGWVSRGISVLLIDYRGYGQSDGDIRKGSDLLEDARGSLRWLVSDKGIAISSIMLYGESIGSYPALALSTEKKFKGLILEAPLSSLKELAHVHYGWVPDFVIRAFSMDNVNLIARTKCPVFILHGEQDEICPISMGMALYENAPSPREIYVVKNGHHNDLVKAAGEYCFDKPYQFIIKNQS